MSSTDVSPSAAGLDIGSRRFLHPGPLRWLRCLGWAVLLFFVFGLTDAAGSIFPEKLFKAQGPLIALATLVICLAGFALYAGLVRLAEARWPSELALRPAATELAIGLAVGAAMLSVVVALLVASGLYEVTGPRASSPWNMISVGVVSGFMEELIFRAIVLRLLMRAFGIWPALALSAALFGALHLSNPNATPTAAIAIAVEAGLMLASFYLLTGRLWMSIGVHAAWNFTQGWIWGARVSGIPVKESLYLSAPRAGAPDWLSGGAFGPEASVPAMVVGTGVAVAVLYWAWKRGNFRAAA
ncbi:CPBP family intramembrane glutamic endopeptidase [Caulobacter soli]|uniref:CPBP family intramembrane glutamic endopeptidase n=1 Tax=Caulobacter soli TaxID=2708539 RepID=UPI0013ED1A99|nr:type II CAAX endopeptidase family protein [Caulobacter soli]